MKFDKKKLPYRLGVIGLVTDNYSDLLLVQMLDYGKNHWRFPGGGVDAGESDEEALLRELTEELGSSHFEIGRKSKYVNEYDWPDRVIEERYLKDGTYWRGQHQTQFLVKFTGKRSELHPDPGELKNTKWVALNELEKHFVFLNQWELAKPVIEELLSDS